MAEERQNERILAMQGKRLELNLHSLGEPGNHLCELHEGLRLFRQPDDIQAPLIVEAQFEIPIVGASDLPELLVLLLAPAREEDTQQSKPEEEPLLFCRFCFVRSLRRSFAKDSVSLFRKSSQSLRWGFAFGL